jgi:polar amino acid transport system ATP-binding protein
MNPSSLIEVGNLHKAYGEHAVLRGVDLSVKQAQATFLIGRSGCGKSTLLRCLNGLEGFELGRIRVGSTAIERGPERKPKDSQLRQLRDHFGMVFQSYNLFPHLTVLENAIKAPMVVKKLTRSEAEAVAVPLLEKVGLKAQLLSYPSQISGGQQQRAAIARALAMSPRVMLYDEPTSALDPWLVDEVFEVMKQLDSEGMTQIVVTHELKFAREAADQVVFMEDGVIVESGAADQVFQNPSDPRTEAFLRKFK